MKNKFYFYLGGFRELRYEIHYKNKKFNISFGSNGQHITFYTDPPKHCNWERFFLFLDSINIWEWKNEYVNYNIVDGTQWEIEFSNSVKKIKSFGSNKFPDKKKFKKLIEEIEILFQLQELKKEFKGN